MYNIISEYFYLTEKLSIELCDIPASFIKQNGFYNNMRYYYAHSYLLLLKLFGVKFYLSDKISTDRMLWISNHRSKLDGLIIQSLLCASKNDTIAVVKNSIRKIPIFGSFGKHVDAIYLDRSNATSDKNLLSITAKKSFEEKKSVLIFPEGTTLSPKSKLVSDAYALRENINGSNFTLIPRTTGFDVLKTDGNFDRIGNITIRYESPSIKNTDEHSYLHLFNLFPKKVYVHIEYLDSNNCDLFNVFSVKDIKLKNPVDPLEYPNRELYSATSLFLNMILFILFYSLCYTVPVFFYITCIVSLYSIVKMWFV